MTLWWLSPLLLLVASRHGSAAPTDSFGESLTLHPLPDGKISVLFEFTTHFSSPPPSSSIPQYHHYLTPPALLLPLEHNDVAELTVSFVAGRWDQRRSGEAGPLHYEAGGGGGEVRGWLRNSSSTVSPTERWTRVTHALGGLFCAGLGPNENGESVNTFGNIYPPLHNTAEDLTHHLLPHANLLLCTENLSPFLSLLPSKGLSGVSYLLAQPSTVFSWGFKTEGIEVIMPRGDQPGRWRGWWEGVVDLIPERGDAKRDFSLHRLFNKGVPRIFPEADESVLRLIMPVEQGLRMDKQPGKTETRWIDGRIRQVVEWDLLDQDLVGDDVKFWWADEHLFHHPRAYAQPPISVFRTVTAPHAGDGIFTIRIEHRGNETRSAVYSELWPWWVKGWLHQMSITQEGHGLRNDLLDELFYKPSTPPTVSSTTLHLTLTIPPQTTLTIRIPFTKLMLKYTDHRPDAERGIEIPSGILTLLDLQEEGPLSIDPSSAHGRTNPKRTGRTRIYTTRLLLDVPTPDFSMPYNVIIMSSTVMAVFFGLMHGTSTRRYGFVQLDPAVTSEKKQE